ncbi:TonB-dependent receptor [Lutibacter citreus]|uniref:TonB-dependent receptor n=1 Tax=Lutibacter citreus TaxID=2138210 RepID=UPI000DBE50E1|nr:TonB-dependent receptor [Lutibacter citreus]
MKKILYLLFIVPLFIFSQERLKGTIYEEDPDNKKAVLPGANVYWLNQSIGAVTDLKGAFNLPYKKEYTKLVVSYIGFKTDTILVNNSAKIKHWLKPKSMLDEVVLTQQKKSSSVSYLKSLNVINVSSDELLKAACCNLAESFETNPSIDVNFSDAVSGTRQIKMLGLTSPNILITTENIPSIRGASQAYGMSFIPGTWVESIQITKGTGSVVNGFESIAGQINAELKKPISDDRLFVNAYASANGRLELNTHLNKKLSEKWSSGLYLHGNLRDKKIDNNNDSFLDIPLAKQINVMNRWQYTNTETGFVSFLNLRYLKDEKQSGQVSFSPEKDKLTTNFWGSEINTERLEVSFKLGYVNPNIPYQSIGLQMAYSNHKQDSYFGLNNFNIIQQSVYSNLIYNTIISDSRHKIKTGVGFSYDKYDEIVLNDIYYRNENNVDGYFEYNYDDLGAINMSAGIRIDHNNLLGTFVTPRFHIRYSRWEKSALRASFGRGKRSANIFAENQKMFATSRTINILNSGGKIYGLDPEIAWNYGVSYLQGFNLFGRKADLNIDFYRTDFKNQVVVDWEISKEISFYNLEGESYSDSFQAEFSYNPFNKFNLKLAYKYYDVKTQYKSGKKLSPLIPRSRIFANASYETSLKKNGSHWKFDGTFNWLSKQRFPSTEFSDVEYQLNKYSSTLATLNMQVTKVFSPKLEVYFGGENITNIKQENPVISAENPFGAHFDTTLVYGPIFGSMYYTGLRYKLN